MYTNAADYRGHMWGLIKKIEAINVMVLKLQRFSYN